MNNLENYMDNLNTDALKQIVRFVCNEKLTLKESGDAIEFVLMQASEFAKMYPKGC